MVSFPKDPRESSVMKTGELNSLVVNFPSYSHVEESAARPDAAAMNQKTSTDLMYPSCGGITIARRKLREAPACRRRTIVRLARHRMGRKKHAAL